jgi:mannose-6-phosphate isomerase-like protein (cupin superfamily)/2'-5' RNA ligase
VRTVSLAGVLDQLLSAASREKTAEISTSPKTFFVHVRVPEHVAENLREIQKKVIPDAAKHSDIDHITLVYTKKPLEDHPPEKVHAALAALRQVGENAEPIEAKIQGWGYFDGAASQGKRNTALVALLDAPGLEHLHVDMVRALKVHGIDPSDKHVFTPHITLGYLGDAGRTEEPLPVINGRFTIDRAHVTSRDHHEIPLTGVERSMGQKAAEAAFPGFITNIDDATNANDNYRKVLHTAKKEQLVVMSLPKGGDIGSEKHPNTDQFIRVEGGQGKAVLNGVERPMRDGTALIIPAGTQHNIVNTGDDPLKLYTVYSQNEHPDGIVEKTKADAEKKEAALGVNAAKFATDFAPKTNFSLDTNALRSQRHEGPGKGQTSPGMGGVPAQTGGMHSGGGLR